MAQQLTNAQILGRLRAEFRGWQVESRDRGYSVITPTGKRFAGRFDEIRNPVALQTAIQAIRDELRKSP